MGSISETRLRSLEIALDCATLGACQKTICWVTGLTRTLVRNEIFGDSAPRRGRPSYSDDFIFRAVISVRADVGVFATNYRKLRDHGFAPGPALVSAYRHRVDAFNEPPCYTFDQAFYLVAHLDGIWAQRTPTLALASCPGCSASRVVPIGSARSEFCPICTPGRNDRPRPTKPTAPSADEDAIQALHTLIGHARYALDLEKLGAHPRIAHLLSKGAMPEGGPKMPQRTLTVWKSLKGRPHDVTNWSASLSPVRRAQYSSLAIQYRRLRFAGFGPEASLQSAFRHVNLNYNGENSLSFDRAFEVISLLEGRWDKAVPVLTLDLCGRCNSLFLISKLETAPPRCPFCRLKRSPSSYDLALAGGDGHSSALNAESAG